MDDNEVQYLEKALNNDNNQSLMNLTFEKIDKKKNKIINEFELTKRDSNLILKKLQDYRLIEELPELQIGNYIRWINLSIKDDKNYPENNDCIELSKGAILSEIKIEENIILVLKNYGSKKFFQINFENNIIFQKLSNQEKIILYALDHINS